MIETKICLLCGNQFTTKFRRQLYCKQPVIKKCSCCGKLFQSICSPDAATTCNDSECKKKAGLIAAVKQRTCRVCGQSFSPLNPRQLDCNQIIKKVCTICGKEFEGKCSLNDSTETCSRECTDRLVSKKRQQYWMKTTRICELCGKEFNPKSSNQKVCDNKHIFNCVICGKEFEIDYQSSKGQADLRKTCSKECESKLRSQRCAEVSPQVVAKMQSTCLARYGVAHPMQLPQFQQRVFNTYEKRTGIDHKIIQSNHNNQFSYEEYIFNWCRFIQFPYFNFIILSKSL